MFEDSAAILQGGYDAQLPQGVPGGVPHGGFGIVQGLNQLGDYLRVPAFPQQLGGGGPYRCLPRPEEGIGKLCQPVIVQRLGGLRPHLRTFICIPGLQQFGQRPILQELAQRPGCCLPYFRVRVLNQGHLQPIGGRIISQVRQAFYRRQPHRH